MYAPQAPKKNLGRYPRFGVVPLAVPLVQKIVGGISFATPSEKRAANVIGPVIASANNGNLNAVAIMDARRNIGIAKERAVWANGFNQVLPAVMAAYAPQAATLKASIPASAEAGPEAAASWALNTTVQAQSTVLQQISDTVVPALLQTPAGQQVQSAAISSAAKSAAAQATSTAKSWLLPAGIVAAFFLLRSRR